MLELKDRWVWDFWFCEDAGVHHIFYLQAEKTLGDERLRHFNARIGHASSTNYIDWDILPEALSPGEPGDWDDQATWTGSTFHHGDTWYLFYTGVNKGEKGLIQRVGVATSKDLIHWDKYAGNPIIEADSKWYELLDLDAWHDHAWRDPWVFEHEGMFHAYITARVNYGVPDSRGVIAHAVSTDLLNWKVKQPVTEPGDFGQLEVPQLIQQNDEYHLVFSTDKFTHSQTYLERTGRQPITGAARYSSNSALGPFKRCDDPWLFGDKSGTLYSAKALDVRGDDWTLIAFENYAQNGEFIGRIVDPFKVIKPK